jgi:hemerythrin
MHCHHSTGPAAALATALQHVRKHLCRQIDQLAAQPDADFAAGWTKLVAATEAAFRHEETVMELAHYPGLAIHRAENARILGALHHVTPRVDGGDSGVGRDALAALAAIVSSHRYGVIIAPVEPRLHGRKAARHER